MLRVIELFSGIGAQSQALKDIGIDFKTVAISEIDKNAIKAYNAIHGNTLNLGDIRLIEHLPECDLLTYSFPCQDLSISGHQLGLVKGARSSLLWDVGRLLTDMADRGILPEYLLMENVDAILNKKNISYFKKWVQVLNDMGYNSSFEIMNAKDYGIPQNRKRCFMVSSLTKGAFIFPEKTKLKTVLKDLLDKDVEESFYLSEEKIKKYEEHRIRQELNNRGFGWNPINPDLVDITHAVTTKPNRHASSTFIIEDDIKVSGKLNISPFYSADTVYDPIGVSPTLTACNTGVAIPKISIDYPTNTKTGFMPASEGDDLVMKRPNKARGTVQKQTAPTLTTNNNAGVVINQDNRLRIRYLTPKECFRLMGFKDDTIDKIIDAVPSKAGLYKLAGNSIVVNCLNAIFTNMFINQTFKKTGVQKSLINFD